MDSTAQKLLGVLTSADLELKVAAIRILDEIDLRGPAVVQALGKCLREPRDELKILALKALSRLGAADIASAVVPLILTDGILREHALAVVTAIGAQAAPPLRDLYAESPVDRRHAVVTALAGIGGQQSLEFLLAKLPDEPFDVQKHLISSLCDALDLASPKEQAPLLELCGKILARRNRTEETLIGVLNILGHFKGRLEAPARAHVEKYADKRHPVEIRRYALLSYGRLLTDLKVSPSDLEFLRKLLFDPDWSNIAQHALVAFRQLQIPKKHLPFLAKILEGSPHVPVQKYIFRCLRESGSKAVPDLALPFLGHPDPALRAEAEETLRFFPMSADTLFSVLRYAKDPEMMERARSVLLEYPPDVKKKLADKASVFLIDLFDESEERYKEFLDLVRSDPEPLRKRLYRQSKTLKTGRQNDRWDRISGYMKLLWDNHFITPEGRYLYALALLKRDDRDLSPSPAARHENGALKVIRALIYDERDHLLRMLRQDKDLKAEEYYYLGFHFAEESEATRPFGVALLEYVVRTYPRSPFRKQAQHKLEYLVKVDEEKAQQPKKRSRKKKSEPDLGPKAREEAAAAAEAAAKKAAKKPAKSAAKKAAKKPAKSAAKKAVKKPAKSDAKKAAKKPAKSDAKKAAKKPAKSDAKKAAKKPAKSEAKKPAAKANDKKKASSGKKKIAKSSKTASGAKKKSASSLGG